VDRTRGPVASKRAGRAFTARGACHRGSCGSPPVASARLSFPGPACLTPGIASRGSDRLRGKQRSISGRGRRGGLVKAGVEDGGNDRYPGGWRHRDIPHQFRVLRRSCRVGRFPAERVSSHAVPLADGFAFSERFSRTGAFRARFCAGKLRSPAQFTDAGLHRVQPPVLRHVSAGAS